MDYLNKKILFGYCSEKKIIDFIADFSFTKKTLYIYRLLIYYFSQRMQTILLEILHYLAYFLPAVLVGVIAHYFFKAHYQDEENRRRHLLRKEALNEILPLRLQAYERMTLFLERIEPSKILIRVKPTNDSLLDYEALLINAIEQEYEHNLTQQIYISKDAWSLIAAAKNTTIQVIRNTVKENNVAHPNKFREELLGKYFNVLAPSQQAILSLKEEVAQLW